MNDDKNYDDSIKQDKIDSTLIEIRKDPYNFICNYAESVYLHIGKKVFEILALMPVSLIIPDIPYMGKKVRSNINCLFLANSGQGKSSIAKLFSTMTLNPLEVESITPAGLEGIIQAKPKFTMVVGDFARMARDPIIIKILEGVLGEEKRIKRQTARKDVDIDTEGCCLLCGTPQDLSHYLSGGLLFRLNPLIILTSSSEHSDIGNHIKNRMGEDGDEDIREEAIGLFYKELEMSQIESHPTIPKITGYMIPKRFKDKAYEEWDKRTKPMVKETNFTFIRGFQEFFRFLISHAFLNIHNRKVIDGKLYPNQEDFDVALRLMKNTIGIQYDILRTERFAKSLKNLSELKSVLSSNIDSKYKEIIKNLVKVENGKIKMKK